MKLKKCRRIKQVGLTVYGMNPGSQKSINQRRGQALQTIAEDGKSWVWRKHDGEHFHAHNCSEELESVMASVRVARKAASDSVQPTRHAPAPPGKGDFSWSATTHQKNRAGIKLLVSQETE
jgi:hypothetical protein